jgi:hypothetical protein
VPGEQEKGVGVVEGDGEGDMNCVVDGDCDPACVGVGVGEGGTHAVSSTLPLVPFVEREVARPEKVVVPL